MSQRIIIQMAEAKIKGLENQLQAKDAEIEKLKEFLKRLGDESMLKQVEINQLLTHANALAEALEKSKDWDKIIRGWNPVAQFPALRDKALAAWTEYQNSVSFQKDFPK